MFLDGRGASSLTGVARCFGLRQHRWTGRPMAGKLQDMSVAGPGRRLDIRAHVRSTESLEA